MFTGIIQKIGKIKSIQNAKFCFSIDDAQFLVSMKVGDSIAVNGVCLTAVEIGNYYFKVDVSIETQNCSTFKYLQVGNTVNLEKALRLNQGINGHLVSAHIDGVGKVLARFAQGVSTGFKIKTPRNLVKYIAKKGAICIDGVSLTVNAIDTDVFDVNIVPHTLNATTLYKLQVGSWVNLEVDIIARHLEQLLKDRI